MCGVFVDALFGLPHLRWPLDFHCRHGMRQRSRCNPSAARISLCLPGCGRERQSRHAVLERSDIEIRVGQAILRQRSPVHRQLFHADRREIETVNDAFSGTVSHDNTVCARSSRQIKVGVVTQRACRVFVNWAEMFILFQASPVRILFGRDRYRRGKQHLHPFENAVRSTAADNSSQPNQSTNQSLKI